MRTWRPSTRRTTASFGCARRWISPPVSSVLTRLYFGSQEAWALTSTRNTAAQAKAKGLDVEAISVPGDHFTAVDPAIRQSLDFFRQHGGGGAAVPAAGGPADNPFFPEASTPATSDNPFVPPMPTPPPLPPGFAPPDFPRVPPPVMPPFGPPGRPTTPGAGRGQFKDWSTNKVVFRSAKERPFAERKATKTAVLFLAAG